MSVKQKVFVITGGSSGIGLATAKSCVADQRHIIIVGRSEDKLIKARDILSGMNANCRITAEVCDLSQLKEIDLLIERIKSVTDRIDVLINNAGVYHTRRQITANGLECQFATNLLAPFYLTRGCMPLLKNSSSARIINVTSGAHRAGRIHWHNLQMKGVYTGINAYSQSKLGLILISYFLAHQLGDGSSVTVNVCEPGLVNTDFGAKHSGKLNRRVWEKQRLRGRSVESAAENIVYLALDPELEGLNGYFWKDGHPGMSSHRSYSLKDAARLWRKCEDLCKTSI